MRSAKMNGYIGDFQSSFLSCEKDAEAIVKKLFFDSRPYSDYLKRLLLINTKDCIDDMTNPVYLNKIKEYSVAKLREDKYIYLEPKIRFEENEEVKSYLVITFDNFIPNASNPYYRDCIIMIDIICHTDCWDIGDYRVRPLRIAGYIDGILNGAKMSGIGKLEFVGCSELVLSESLSGYCLMYAATHSVDDAGDVYEVDGQ
jgi:hypothetical protein